MRFDENLIQTIMKHNQDDLHEPHSYLYEIYAHGWHGVKKDPEEAKIWLMKAETSKDPEISEQARRLLKDIEDDSLVDLSDDII